MPEVDKPYLKWPVVCPVYNTQLLDFSAIFRHREFSAASNLPKSPTPLKPSFLMLWNSPHCSSPSQSRPSVSLYGWPPWGRKWPGFLIHIIHTTVWMVKMFNSFWSGLHSKRGFIWLMARAFLRGGKWRKGNFSHLLSLPQYRRIESQPFGCLPSSSLPR